MTPQTALSQSPLDDLLNRIGGKLQITETMFLQAESRYHIIGEWLRAEGSPVSIFKPEIYPQGSLRIQTTVKPRGECEFDLDFVCEFQADPDTFYNPVEILNIIEKRLRENKIYEGMIERKNRCIRINYANQFHMDILPACPNPAAFHYGDTRLVIPDRNARCWKHSNPRGYARWFDETAVETVTKLKRNVEPLPEQQAYEDLVTLKRAVQLLKRYRDVSLDYLPEKERPISIVLTTLAAQNYYGQRSVVQAINDILEGIINGIPSSGRIVVLNPTNDQEDLSERWDKNPQLYITFINWVKDFKIKWESLAETRGIQNIKLELEKMFGERVTKEVVEDYVKSYEPLRNSGSLAVSKGSGIIVPATTVSSVPIKKNTFYGD